MKSIVNSLFSVDSTERLENISMTGNLTCLGSASIAGDLSVAGEVITNSTSENMIENNKIYLNSGVTGTPSLDASYEVERGTSTNSSLYWDETSDKWRCGLTSALQNIARIDSSATNTNLLYYDSSSDILRSTNGSYSASTHTFPTVSVNTLTSANSSITLTKNIMPSTDDTFDIGSASYRLREIYSEITDGQYLISRNILIGDDIEVKTLNADLNLVPNGSGKVVISNSLAPSTTGLTLGIAIRPFTSLYAGGIFVNSSTIMSDSGNNLSLASIGVGTKILLSSSCDPNVDNTLNLGQSSKRFANLYAGGVSIISSVITPTTTNADLKLCNNGTGAVKHYINGRYRTLGFLPVFISIHDVCTVAPFAGSSDLHVNNMDEGANGIQTYEGLNAWITFTKTGLSVGVYRIIFYLGRKTDRGIIRVSVNNTDIADFDSYSPDGTDPTPSTAFEVYYDLTTATDLIVKFLTIGKNASSSDYWIVLTNAITIYKVSD